MNIKRQTGVKTTTTKNAKTHAGLNEERIRMNPASAQVSRGAVSVVLEPGVILAQSVNQTQVPPSVSETPEWVNRRATDQAVRAANARRNSGRRRFVDPTTCERDYSRDELEFMQAMQEYKMKSGRMFPTWSEVLEVLRSLGYEKASQVEELLAAMA